MDEKRAISFSDEATLEAAASALCGLSESGAASDQLRRRLEANDGDRLAYDQLALAMIALEGGSGDLCSGQHDRILDALLASAADEIAADERAASASSWGLRWIPTLALGVAVMFFGLLYLARSAPPATGLQSRGAKTTIPQSSVGLDIHCVRGGDLREPPIRDNPLVADARCRLGDELQLSLTHLADFRHLLIVGLLEDEKNSAKHRLYYYPVPPTGRSARAPTKLDHEALGQAITLAINHRPGWGRVVALFSRRPLSTDVVFRWLDALGDSAAADSVSALGSGVVAIEKKLTIEENAR